MSCSYIPLEEVRAERLAREARGEGFTGTRTPDRVPRPAARQPA
jgi:hypothetical protein